MDELRLGILGRCHGDDDFRFIVIDGEGSDDLTRITPPGRLDELIEVRPWHVGGKIGVDLLLIEPVANLLAEDKRQARHTDDQKKKCAGEARPFMRERPNS